MIDVFTKFLITVPIKHKTANTVARAVVDHLVCYHGCPCSIVTDGGSEFVNKILDKVAQLLKVKKVVTTPYHHSSNGAIEPTNGTIVGIVCTLVTGDTRN